MAGGMHSLMRRGPRCVIIALPACRADVDRVLQSVGDAGVDAARGSLTTRLSAVERGVG